MVTRDAEGKGLVALMTSSNNNLYPLFKSPLYCKTYLYFDGEAHISEIRTNTGIVNKFSMLVT